MVTKNIEKIKKKCPKQALEDFYINGRHSFKDTLNKFKISQQSLSDLLSYYGFKKSKEQILNSRPDSCKSCLYLIDVEQFKKDYLSRNFRQADLAKKYGITLNQTRRIIYTYKLNTIKKDAYFTNYSFDEFIRVIDNSANKNEILRDLENYIRADFAKKYKVSKSTVNKLIEHYHITNVAKKEGYKRADETKIKRYGSKNNIEKIKKTNLIKYGCEYAGQCEESKEKAKKTKLERYGSETYNNRGKFLDTMHERYGEGWKSVMEKVQATNIARYGVKNYSMTRESRNEQSLKLMTLSINSSCYSDEYKELYVDKEKSIDFLSQHSHEFTAFDLAKRFNCGRASIYI